MKRKNFEPDGTLVLKISEKKLMLHVGFCITVFIVAILLQLFYTANINLSELPNSNSPNHTGQINERIIWDLTLRIAVPCSFFFLMCAYIGRWLVIKFFLKNKMNHFLLGVIAFGFILITIGTICTYFFLQPTNIRLAGLVLFSFPIVILGLGSGIVIKMITALVKRQLEDSTAFAAQKQSELSLLQNQLSPHFLFNTLNNLHSISILKHEMIPKLLLKLSDLLRHSIYDTDQKFVTLSDEVAYIYNYIEFEKLRIGDRLFLETDIKGTSENLIIAPMLLIVFIENAFKHSKNSIDEKIYVEIVLKVDGHRLLFSVCNSYGPESQAEFLSGRQRSGLGLSNTMKRLNLLYQGNYTFEQNAINGLYRIDLNINLIAND